MKKRLGFLAVLLVLACVLTVGALAAGGWQQLDYGEWYYYNDDGSAYNGWLQDGGYWYYIKWGRMVANDVLYVDSGAGTDDYICYGFDANGHMVTGWFQCYGDWFYFDNTGKGVDGWRKIDGSWYYFNNCRMAANGVEWTRDEDNGEYCYYLFDANGHILPKEGWYAQDEWYDDTYMFTLWYYFDANGKGYDGWLKSGGWWYYFDGGAMAANGAVWTRDEDNNEYCYYRFDADGHIVYQAGWYSEERWYGENDKRTVWFYFDANGKGHDGWLKLNGWWYYFDGGVMAADGAVWTRDEDSGYYGYYLFDADGHILPQAGWYSEDRWYGENDKRTAWFYFDANGRGHDGWLKLNGWWYYFNGGEMAANGAVWTDDGDDYVYYLFDANGHILPQAGWYRQTEWYGENDQRTVWYYFDANGKGYDGWLKSGGCWYYIDHGQMLSDGICYAEKDETYYNFDANGHFVVKTGWVSETWTHLNKDYTQWFYFDKNGKGVTGWYKDSDGWYYLDGGEMVAYGSRSINGSVYVFENNYMVTSTGWYKQQAARYNNGWKTYDQWYYLASTGRAATGWQQIGGSWYWFSEDGQMAANETVTINGKNYTFNASGVWVS